LERSDTASDIAGVTCERLSFPVRLSPVTPVSYPVGGELCYAGESVRVDQIVHVLVSGAGYGPVYWNPSFQPDTYSYVAAVSGSYPTFNYARPGVAESGRPFGLKTDVDVQAFVLAQVIVHLNGHLGRPADDDGVMVVGHSMGSLITQAHALAYPGTTRGAILTGTCTASTPTMGKRPGRTAVSPWSTRSSRAGSSTSPTSRPPAWKGAASFTAAATTRTPR